MINDTATRKPIDFEALFGEKPRFGEDIPFSTYSNGKPQMTVTRLADGGRIDRHYLETGELSTEALIIEGERCMGFSAPSIEMAS